MATPRDAMEPRLLAVLANNGVSTTTMDTMATAGLTAFTVFTHLATDRAQLCTVISKAPLEINDSTFDKVLEQAKVVAAWEASKIMREVEVKRDSERRALNLPPELQVGDLETAIKVFE